MIKAFPAQFIDAHIYHFHVRSTHTYTMRRFFSLFALEWNSAQNAKCILVHLSNATGCQLFQILSLKWNNVTIQCLKFVLNGSMENVSYVAISVRKRSFLQRFTNIFWRIQLLLGVYWQNNPISLSAVEIGLLLFPAFGGSCLPILLNIDENIWRSSFMPQVN